MSKLQGAAVPAAPDLPLPKRPPALLAVLLRYIKSGAPLRPPGRCREPPSSRPRLFFKLSSPRVRDIYAPRVSRDPWLEHWIDRRR